jgi:N-glycosylase/DNA lyase
MVKSSAWMKTVRPGRITSPEARGPQCPERVVVQAPVPFDLDLAVRSHGWYDLAPWRYDRHRVVGRPLRLEGGPAVYAEVAEGAVPGSLLLRLTSPGRLGAAAAAEARRQVRTCLGLDEDLRPFLRLVEELERGARPASLPAVAGAARRGAGRLLRSPTVFEDAVKTLCTTNCSWALTRTMVSNLVERLGEEAPLGSRCFPAAEAMARRPERFYREVVRAGYRAPFLLSLARAAASGRPDLEAWRDPRRPADDLAREIRSLPGFGPYATEHLLRLLGRYRHLALDSSNRRKLARLRGRRRLPSDRAVERWFAPYGEWAGLAMWLEVTADWHLDPPAWPPPERGVERA